jgi:hypothetical protein
MTSASPRTHRINPHQGGAAGRLHRTYFDALQQAESLDGQLRNDNKQAIKFKVIASVPSFEIWLLLHYERWSGDTRNWQAVCTVMLNPDKGPAQQQKVA